MDKIKFSTLKPFGELPDNESIVSMVNYKDKIVVASNKHVYILSENGNLQRVKFEVNNETTN